MVTVALPTYQRATQLRRAIESVLCQDYEPIELIISDNASTDGTQALCEDYARQDPRVRYLRRDQNIGPTPNFDSLRSSARGSYFVFLGDDDWIDPGYVGACVFALEASPALALVAGRVVNHDPDGKWPEPLPMNVDDPDPRCRVLNYCRQVWGNGVFYGVTPTACDRRLPPLRNVMGGDWLRVMGLAYLGGIKTVDDVEVHRTTGGTTESLANVARVLKLGWVAANAPQVAISYWVFRDVAFDSPVYADLGRPGRVWLGLRAATIVLRRFVPGAVVKFTRIRLRSLTRRLRGVQPSSDGA